ncbi:MAG: hypothetical protein H6619_02620 [Deltaproteobacteria bacterium]|nr:hypothetical protein [Deltaproteobacteria bacterium]
MRLYLGFILLSQSLICINAKALDSSAQLFSETNTTQLKSSCSRSNLSPVSCAHVVTDNDKHFQASCNIGGLGHPCREDNFEAVCCSSENLNPIQSAIDIAKAESMQLIRLDSGTFEIGNYKTSYGWKVGIHVPSEITIEGINNGDENTTEIVVSDDIEMPNLDVGIVISEDLNNRNIAASNISIKKINLDGNNKTNVLIYGLKSSGNIHLDQIKVRDAKISGIILGQVAKYHKNPSDPSQAMIYSFDGIADEPNTLTNCEVSDVEVDGIMIIGKHVKVEGCNVKQGNSFYSNGIGTFSGAAHVQILNNSIQNFKTGIGLDGSFPGYCSAAENCGDLGQYGAFVNQIGIGRPEGSGYDIEVRGNFINSGTAQYENGPLGIHVWRGSDVSINGNNIVGNFSTSSKGIILNETFGSSVFSNLINNFQIGIELYSNGYSGFFNSETGELIGTSFNGIGYDKNPESQGTKPNFIINSVTGINLTSSNLDGANIAQNYIVGNQIYCSFGSTICSHFTGCNLSGSNQGAEKQYCSSNYDQTNSKTCNFGDKNNHQCQSGNP